MKFKKIIGSLLSAAILSASGFVTIPSSANEKEDYSAYLFAYFRKPAGQRDDERLCYGVSRDGYTFRALNGGEPIFAPSKSHTPGLQYEALRDPFIVRGEDGKFYIVVTDLFGTSNPNHQITIYPTEDLVNIEQGIVIDYSKYEGFEDTRRAWAPQIIWCPDHENDDGTTGAYMIYLAIYKGDPDSTDMYKHFTTDLSDPEKYTVPELMLEGEDEASIDGDIIYDPDHDEYVMYYNGQSIATSSEIDGTYTKQSHTVFSDARRVEGSNMFKLNNEDTWIYCADGGSFSAGFNMTQTSDFETYTEIRPKSDTNTTGYDYDFTPRHGYVIPITESELDKLMDEYGYVDLPDRFSDSPLENLTLPYTTYGYKIAGNITLPQEIDGQEITWTSSKPDVINTEVEEFSTEDKEKYGENYTEIPAGVVTRQVEDTKVTLTASVADGDKEYTKKFIVTVKAAPEKSYAEMDEDGDFKAYLYASFIEPPKDVSGQQVYFASSDDGRNWTDLNSNKPVLSSKLGTGSTRDHYIIRTPEGDRFYIIATDLNCFASGKTWDDYAQRGSKYIMVWETDDLVNWSEQRMVKIADEDTGCAWAPETIYDDLTGEYIVYWSGHDINQESESYGKKVVYYSKTRDFYSFTPQERYVLPESTDGVDEGTSESFIDTTMIKGSDGRFYRVTKYDEVSPTRVFMDVADYPLGKFERVQTNLSDNTFLGTEGPGWFKYNKDDAEEFGAKYCLMLDGYNGPNKNVGFFPTTIADLNVGDDFTFTRVTSNFKMRTNAKHGGIVPITQEEYDRVNATYINIEKADLSPYTSESDKIFDIADTYPDYPASWTLPDDKSLDNNTHRYLGINGKMNMGDGYGAGSKWVTIRFDMAANSGGDNIIRDIDGKSIIGYCYASGSDGLWVGHGERSYGGTVNDIYGAKRLSNYLKTEIGDRSDRDNTGHSIYAQHDICTIIMENATGTVDNYKGDYYTVKTYIDEELLSTEYYSGNFNGIGSIESNVKQYFGQICIYMACQQKPDIDITNEHLLFAVDFNDETTTAQKGIATAYGISEYTTGNDGSKAAVFDGTSSYIYATKTDGTPLLRGTDKAVINMNVKMEQPTTTNGWYFYTSWSDGSQNDSRRSYTGILCSGSSGNIVAERYRDNSGTPTITANTSFNSWHEVTYIIDGYIAELYIDGSFVGSQDYKASGEDHILSTILGTGDDIVMYFGKANWGSGEYAKGAFNDIEVYDFAPSIDLGKLDNVRCDLELPTPVEETDGYSITWASSNEDIISSNGKVTRPAEGEESVTLMATIKFGNTTLTRTYDVTVTAFL